MHRFRSDLKDRKVAHITVPLKRRMMCLNESVLDPYQSVREAFLLRMDQVHLNRYFSEVSVELAQELADYVGHGVTPDMVVWGNGADDMLYHVFMAVRENDRSFLAAMSPSYFDYKCYANAVGLQARFVPLDEHFDFDLAAYLALAADPDCKLCVVCQPNNPTGNLFDEEKILAILRGTTKPVLVDEAYFEFAGQTLVSKLDEFPNLMVVRSFSKSFSAAGLRFGYLVSQRENTDQVRKVMTFFHSSIFIQTLALTMLEHRAVFIEHTRRVCEMRDELLAAMCQIPGLRVWPSHTNFLLFSAGDCSAALHLHLQDCGIAVRDVGAHPRLAECLRVTVTSEDDNRVFLKSMRTFLDGKDKRRT
ncbi:MAG: histidinol-phosphate aminotransferase family protein [Candidatus Cloacimonetes bacterium]|nr:histidinol-phosphate aminotransferase family protein [Candidatus Cloacimonadota bacterium]